jgi:peptidoglycan/xylan/chitin deacetylase (PgdA/CDA1 family)
MEPVRLRSRLLAAGLSATGVLRLRERHVSGATVVAYHGIVDHADDPVLDRFSVDVRVFRSHLAFFRRRCQPVSLAQLIARLQEGGDVPPGWVAVTLDDGLLSQARIAAPLLREYGIPWAWSIPAGLVGTGRAVWMYEMTLLIMRCWRLPELPPLPGQTVPWPTRTLRERALACQGIKGHLIAGCTASQRRAYLNACLAQVGEGEFLDALCRYGRFTSASWDDVRACARDGVELLSHGWSHEPHNGQLEEAESRQELIESRERIGEMTGCLPAGFAMPAGRSTPNLAAALAKAGYTYGVTSEPARVHAGCSLFAVPRTNGEYPLSILRRELIWESAGR